MALLAYQGFDDGLASVEGWAITTILSAGARTGTNGVQLGDSGNKIAQWDFSSLATPSTFVLGFAYNVFDDGGRTTMDVLHLNDGGTINLNLYRRIGGEIYVTGAWGTSSDSAAGVMPEAAWIYVEIKMTIDNSAGAYEIRVNGVNVLSDSAIDTQSGSNAYCDLVRWEGIASTDPWISYMDDVYLVDDTTSFNNDFHGDTRVYTLLPIGDGNTSAMTGSDLDQIDNWDLVNNTTPSSTDWVGSVTEGHLDTYDMTSLGSTAYTIQGVITTVWGAKSDAGTKYMRHVVRTGTTGGAQSDNVSTSYALGTGYTPNVEVWNTNPVSSTQWTAGEVEAMEVGQEARNS